MLASFQLQTDNTLQTMQWRGSVAEDVLWNAIRGWRLHENHVIFVDKYIMFEDSMNFTYMSLVSLRSSTTTLCSNRPRWVFTLHSNHRLLVPVCSLKKEKGACTENLHILCCPIKTSKLFLIFFILLHVLISQPNGQRIFPLVQY